ncbi:hypothetical protein ACFXP7_00930 [Microbacterium sp. P06]|uniref:DUF7882 family protein n=1 Tax=Microbacterium sp. P06 TaxID=3366949 RepID=UPI0037475706
MAKLFYGGGSTPIELPDRLLAHVKIVIAAKLRRGESFTLTWRHPDDAPGGRTTVWVQPAIPLRFVFSGVEPELLDPDLLRSLANQAATSGGLMFDLNDVVDTVAPARAVSMA